MNSEIPPDRPPLAPALPLGSYAVDTRTDRIGRIMDRHGGLVQLRPPGGGREWDCPPDLVRRATRAESLRADVARMNAESGWRV
ncbi:hypothetical protein SSP35_03_02270 [Streptomyces sp. NBRC 110611]|uniref:hypothetical protein n=1 Tax=Streptomyces sp. NBRC 110611 TaxID=1621259 RepID=UPI000831AD81|nr:hypothetical protein [Streptomyces sp. NBRC 110611]GAU66579.1 hypothetical protein SSP35_03_02270 [Streptomyces sp. NBRC 110611]